MKMKSMNLKKFSVLIPIVTLMFAGSGCKQKSVDKLLEKGKVRAAEKRCEKANAEEKSGCYKTIAAFYLQKGHYKRAAVYYAKAGDHISVINSYFRGDLIPEAEKYCANRHGNAKKQCAERLARKFFINGNYRQAVRYYKIAGENRAVSYIETRVPVFQLVEQIGHRLKEKTAPGVGAGMSGIKQTLTAYIYMDKYREWPYRRESGPDTGAADIFARAKKMLETGVVPTFIEKLTGSSFDWSKKSIESVSFDHLKLESLINLIKSLHHIAGKREFFTRYSVVYYGEAKKKGGEAKKKEGEAKKKEGEAKKKVKETPKSFNYEKVYLKALDHSRTLLATIEEAGRGEKKEWLQDYKDDLTVDIKVIDYISSMMDNIKIRIEDIRKRSRRLRKNSKNGAVKKMSEKLFWDFVAVCNRVLHAVSKEEYQKANDLLISGYETAKAGIIEVNGS
jgi:tetratricopeptide (TPR) repeat protein